MNSGRTHPCASEDKQRETFVTPYQLEVLTVERDYRSSDLQRREGNQKVIPEREQFAPQLGMDYQHP